MGKIGTNMACGRDDDFGVRNSHQVMEISQKFTVRDAIRKTLWSSHLPQKARVFVFTQLSLMLWPFSKLEKNDT